MESSGYYHEESAFWDARDDKLNLSKDPDVPSNQAQEIPILQTSCYLERLLQKPKISEGDKEQENVEENHKSVSQRTSRRSSMESVISCVGDSKTRRQVLILHQMVLALCGKREDLYAEIQKLYGRKTELQEQKVTVERKIMKRITTRVSSADSNINDEIEILQNAISGVEQHSQRLSDISDAIENSEKGIDLERSSEWPGIEAHFQRLMKQVVLTPENKEVDLFPEDNLSDQIQKFQIECEHYKSDLTATHDLLEQANAKIIFFENREKVIIAAAKEREDALLTEMDDWRKRAHENMKCEIAKRDEIEKKCEEAVSEMDKERRRREEVERECERLRAELSNLEKRFSEAEENAERKVHKRMHTKYEAALAEAESKWKIHAENQKSVSLPERSISDDPEFADLLQALEISPLRETQSDNCAEDNNNNINNNFGFIPPGGKCWKGKETPRENAMRNWYQKMILALRARQSQEVAKIEGKFKEEYYNKMEELEKAKSQEIPPCQKVLENISEIQKKMEVAERALSESREQKRQLQEEADLKREYESYQLRSKMERELQKMREQCETEVHRLKVQVEAAQGRVLSEREEITRLCLEHEALVDDLKTEHSAALAAMQVDLFQEKGRCREKIELIEGNLNSQMAQLRAELENQTLAEKQDMERQNDEKCANLQADFDILLQRKEEEIRRLKIDFQISQESLNDPLSLPSSPMQKSFSQNSISRSFTSPPKIPKRPVFFAQKNLKKTPKTNKGGQNKGSIKGSCKYIEILDRKSCKEIENEKDVDFHDDENLSLSSSFQFTPPDSPVREPLKNLEKGSRNIERKEALEEPLERKDEEFEGNEKQKSLEVCKKRSEKGGENAMAGKKEVAEEARVKTRCSRCKCLESEAPEICIFHPYLTNTPGPYLYGLEWHVCRENRHSPQMPGCCTLFDHFFPGQKQAQGLSEYSSLVAALKQNLSIASPKGSTSKENQVQGAFSSRPWEVLVGPVQLALSPEGQLRSEMVHTPTL